MIKRGCHCTPRRTCPGIRRRAGRPSTPRLHPNGMRSERQRPARPVAESCDHSGYGASALCRLQSAHLSFWRWFYCGEHHTALSNGGRDGQLQQHDAIGSDGHQSVTHTLPDLLLDMHKGHTPLCPTRPPLRGPLRCWVRDKRARKGGGPQTNHSGIPLPSERYKLCIRNDAS